MLFVIILMLFFQITFGAQVPMCKAVTYSQVVFDTDDNWNPLTTVYSYNFTLKNAVNKNNETFPNVITVFDFQDWSLNSSLYYRTSPSWFSYTIYVSDPFSLPIYFNCTYNETCILVFPNGRISSNLNMYYNSYGNVTVLSDNVMLLNDGTILGPRGVIMYPNKCINYGPSHGTYDDHFSNNISICCIENDYVEISNNSENECKEFTSQTTVTDNAQNFSFDLTAKYYIEKTRLYRGSDNITLIANSSIISDIDYPNKIVLISSNRLCHLYIHFRQRCQGYYYTPNDTDWDFVLSIDSKKYPSYRGIRLGEIMKINGTLLKKNFEPFTPNEPCQTPKVSGLPFSSATYKSTFCCTKFNEESTTTAITPINITPKTTETTTPVTSTKISTTKPQPSSDPQSNFIGSPCSNDTTEAWLDIVFVVDTSKVMSKGELYQLSGQISSYMMGFTFAQTGFHTVRAAIIGYASDVTTYYQLTDTTNYNDFVDVLYQLADHGNSDDEGGNLQGALQQAYNLSVSQKSHRRQLLVVIAAAYNPQGFQDAGLTASNIKENGICIVVINFASSEGVLATALQNISCSGYYYISNEEALNLKFPYALTQLNCYCPTGSLQFREYNTAWTNYTNYADCMYGYNVNILPQIAQKSCHPGILVAVTSQEKLDFITDNILPYIMPNTKKFTIGLHKSSFDGEWKWWGYNQTEYSLGNYPQMSNTSSIGDNYGYMWNYSGFKWSLQSGNNFSLPYICQSRACDAGFICDQTQAKKNMKSFEE